jgi:hypothetical protein
MVGLKEDNKHEILLIHPTNIMEIMQNDLHVQAKNKATHKSTIGAYTTRKDHFGGHNTSTLQPKRLKPQQMEEEEKNDYVSITTTSALRGINVVKINYSTYIVKRKKIACLNQKG